jgi:hypothetical protein
MALEMIKAANVASDRAADNVHQQQVYRFTAPLPDTC